MLSFFSSLNFFIVYAPYASVPKNASLVVRRIPTSREIYGAPIEAKTIQTKGSDVRPASITNIKPRTPVTESKNEEKEVATQEDLSSPQTVATDESKIENNDEKDNVLETGTNNQSDANSPKPTIEV